MKQQESDLRKREAELKTEASGRVAAEATAASAAQELDRVLKDVDWLNYTENLVTADKMLQEGNAVSAANALQRCPKQHRAWEWYYLNALASGLKPTTETLQNVAILDRHPPIVSSDTIADLRNGYRLADRPTEKRVDFVQFYQIAPIKLIKQIEVNSNRSQPDVKLVSPDRRTAVFRHSEFFLWDIERRKTNS